MISDLLDKVEACLEHDSTCQEYTDGGRFVLSLTPAEMIDLERIREKLTILP